VSVTEAHASVYDARMKHRMRMVAALAALAFVPAAAAVTAFNVNEPWVKPAAAGASTEAYMEVRSTDPVTLVDARCALAASVVLVTRNGRKAAPFGLALPAAADVSLSAGGTRLSLVRIARPLAPGDRVPLTIVLRRADGTLQEVDVDAEVRRHSPSYDHGVGRAHRH
jgi:copper(I)-binding protein